MNKFKTKINKIIRYILKNDVIFFFLLFIAGVYYSINMNHYEPGHWKSEIRADRAGYYVYLPATFLYHFNPNNFPENIEDKTGYGFFLDYAKNKVRTKYTYGVALLYSPFFITSHFLAKVTDRDASGFSKIYYRFTDIGGVFYLIFGLFFLYLFLTKRFNKLFSWLIILMTLFGTNLLYYGTIEPLMSHVYSFFLFSFLLYSTDKLFQETKNNYWLFVFVTICTVLIGLVRPSNILFAILIILFLNVGTINDFKNRIKHLFNFKYITIFIIVFIILVIPQLLYWKYVSGSYFHYSYENESFLFWKDPQLIKVLFSTNNGLLLYTPFYILPIIASIWMIFNRKQNGLLILISLLLMIYISAAWHCYSFGCSFSQRNCIDLLPLLSIASGTAIYSIQKIRYIIIKLLFFLVLFIFIYYNLRLTNTYERCFFSYEPWNWLEYKEIVRKTGIDIPVDKFTYFCDFEYTKHDKLVTNINTIEENSKSYSGKKLSHIRAEDIFGIGIKNKIRKFLPTGVKKIYVKFKAYFVCNVKNMKLVYSILTPNNQSVTWNSYDLSESGIITNQWTDVNFEINTDKINDLNNILAIYIWNPGKEEVLIDDLQITFYDQI